MFVVGGPCRVHEIGVCLAEIVDTNMYEICLPNSVCILGSMSLHTRRQKKETFVGSCFAFATYVLLFCLCATCDMYFIVCIIHFAIRDVDYRLFIYAYLYVYIYIYIYTKAFAERLWTLC